MPIEMLKRLPKAAREMWEAIYKEAKPKYGEDRAGKIAWAAVKKKFKKVEDKWVAKAKDLNISTVIFYKFIADEASISKSEDGYSYMDYVLSSSTEDLAGHSFGGMALTSMVEQINKEGLVGRIENGQHELWKRLKDSGKTPDEIEAELQNLDTGIKAVSARKESNKVIARLRVRQDIMNEVMKYDGASIEARFPKEAMRAGVIGQARLQGFVLTNNPTNPDARRVM